MPSAENCIAPAKRLPLSLKKPPETFHYNFKTQIESVMKHQSKFTEKQQQQQHAAEQQVQQPAGTEFATPEELLRFDAARTPVPPPIGERLAKSAAGIPGP